MNQDSVFIFYFMTKCLRQSAQCRTRCKYWSQKVHLSGWIAERTDSRNLALDSVWSDSSTISQSVFFSELLSFGLSRFCPSLGIFKQKLKNFATIQVMSESLQTYTWAMLLWNFSKFWSNKILAESPLTERSLKFHWDPSALGLPIYTLFLAVYKWQLILYCFKLLLAAPGFLEETHAGKGIN